MFNEFLKSTNSKFDLSLTKFGIDIKKYDGIEKVKTRTNNVVNIDIKKLKEFLFTKFKIEFVDFNDENIEEEEEEEINPLDRL